MSEERTQTVVFMRHAVARHNLRDPHGQPPNLHDPALLDPPLVDQGKAAALQAGERVRTWWHTTQRGESIELVVTSPLSRCIQTAILAFLPGSDYDRHAPFVCREEVREAFGSHYPDQRRKKSLLMKHWPMVHFDPQMTENDDRWRPDWRENWEDISRRIELFLAWLVQQSQENVVVVSHGVWIEHLFRVKAPDMLQNGNRRVHNLDSFACQIVSRGGHFLRIEKNGFQI